MTDDHIWVVTCGNLVMYATRTRREAMERMTPDKTHLGVMVLTETRRKMELKKLRSLGWRVKKIPILGGARR